MQRVLLKLNVTLLVFGQHDINLQFASWVTYTTGHTIILDTQQNKKCVSFYNIMYIFFFYTKP